jgi:hypothetical protein
MKLTRWFFILCVLPLVHPWVLGQQQEKPVVVSPVIGDTLDATEREKFQLFPNVKGFEWAVFYLGADSSLVVKASLLEDGVRRDTIIARYRTISTLTTIRNQIRQLAEVRTATDIYRDANTENRPRQSEQRSAWLNAGLGVGSAGLPGGVSFSYRAGSSLISLRCVYSEESDIEIFGPSPSEWVMDIGVLYGVSAKASYGQASLSGGVSLVRGVPRGRYLGSSGGWFGKSNYEELSYSTFGIPIEGQLFWTPSSRTGIGVCAFADLNGERSFAGALLCLQIAVLQ